MKLRLNASGFITRNDNSFLIVKRSVNDSFLPNKWELPGGGLGDNEEPQKGVQREIQEETGLSVSVGKPLDVHTFVMPDDSDGVSIVEITFLCHLIGHEDISLSFEHQTYQWIRKDEIENFDLSDYMKQVINDSLLALGI